MAQRKPSPFKTILNPNTKGLPRETFEHLYPEKKTITIPKAVRGVTKPARRTRMKRKPQGPAKPYRAYKKQEGGFLEGAKDFFKTGRLFGITPTKPKPVVGKGGADQFGRIVKRTSSRKSKN